MFNKAPRDAFAFSLGGVTTISSVVAAPAVADDRLNRVWDDRLRRARADRDRQTSPGSRSAVRPEVH